MPPVTTLPVLVGRFAIFSMYAGTKSPTRPANGRGNGHAQTAKASGSATNPDTGCPVETDGVRLSALDFEKKRLHQIVDDSRAGKTKFSALWQADGSKIVRMAPAEYMGRYMPEWFDYAIADEIHQLAGDTAQGNASGC